MTSAGPSQIQPEAPAVVVALDQVRTTLALALGLVGTGRRVDLTGLDAAAGRLCARVLDLPPGEGAALRPALTELETRLSTLAGVLQNHAR